MLSCSSWRTLGSGLSVIALLLSPVVASAAPILYTDREAFLAAANPDRLLTFDEPTLGVFEGIPGETPIGPTTFYQVRYDFGDVQAVYREGSFQNIRNPLDQVLPVYYTVSVSLPANTYAVGVDLLQAAITPFDIRFSDGAVWSQYYSPPGCSYPNLAFSPPCVPFSGFIGVVDDSDPISGFFATAFPPGALFEPRAAFGAPAVLDNLLIHVPEPATALLLAVGLVGVCWRGRRAK